MNTKAHKQEDEKLKRTLEQASKLLDKNEEALGVPTHQVVQLLERGGFLIRPQTEREAKAQTEAKDYLGLIGKKGKKGNRQTLT